ncbi:hypothetical protein [Erythrobacter ani]|uniref:DUF1330 domain-containing protein n=1 Tax=Erythrobacter ani TaxID=2827235 RepID=A0ABS6SJ16_9SPHN|nr:hypothetical protein [Erythrobacter ani]MBV7264985.1 hypothetical protein [Erythrobacter ani]
MSKFVKSIAGGFAAATLAMSTPALADIEVYEDYQPSDEVVEMTLVKVDEGQFETYLEGLRSTWAAANQVQKDLGYIKDFAIYGVPYGENEFNMVLVVVFPDTASVGPSKERYMAFLDAYGKANIDQGNTTVLELYNKIRKIQGTYMLREVEMLK